VLRAAASARLVIIGQAPGTKVHESGVPWDDASGERLRSSLDLDPEHFYDESRVAIVPMGFFTPALPRMAATSHRGPNVRRLGMGSSWNIWRMST